MKVRLATSLLIATAMLAGCTPAPEDLTVTGTVKDTTQTVEMPSIAVPLVSLDAGFADLTGSRNPVTGRTGTLNGTVATDYGLGSTVQIQQLLVEEGDSVTAGDVVAKLDQRPLRAELRIAKANVAAAASQVAVLVAAIDTTYDKQADISDAKAEVRDAIAKLTRTRAKLAKTKAKLAAALPKVRSGQAKLRAGLGQLNAALRQVDTGLAQVNDAIAAIPEGVPVPPELTAKQAELKAAKAKLIAKRRVLRQKQRQVAAVARKLNTGLRKINTALPKIDTGLRKARKALVKLNEIEGNIIEARTTLQGLREVAELQTDAMRYSPDLVRAELELTELTAPVSGVVVSAANTGDNLAPGATVVTLRESAPSEVTVWLSPSQLSQVCEGDQAQLRTDWNDTVSPATLARIGTQQQYPPTYVATDEVHLTRAIEVSFTTDTELPAGAPVELTISGCHQTADTTATDR